MITGIGTDITETERIKKAIEKEKGFRELVFSAAEIAYCSAQAQPYQHYAARFAAKEAFFKALGTGWAAGTAFSEVEVEKDGLGKPFITLRGQTASVLPQLKNTTIWLSLSHITSAATAVVVIEQL